MTVKIIKNTAVCLNMNKAQRMELGESPCGSVQQRAITSACVCGSPSPKIPSIQLGFKCC